MRPLLFAIAFFCPLLPPEAAGQSIGSSLPGTLDPSARYLFYQHGGVVTVLGDMAINQSVPEWGPYEYRNILDSLRSRGFHVISERRREGVDDSVYVGKIVGQIDTLFRAGVWPRNILVVGASAGWNITLHVASRLQHRRMRYVLMGGCWPDTYQDYKELTLSGRFLSIIEASDPHGTCFRIFQGRRQGLRFREITLHTGLSHGFIYKGYREWIDPIMEWWEGK